MAKAVLFVPRDDMLSQAKKLAQNYRIEFIYMKEIVTADSMKEAQKAVAAGAELIIARGMQATLCKSAVSLPVVEIMLTGQEMGQLIIKAKNMVNKPCPSIGVIGFRNMFCDMSSFNELHEVDLHEYFVDENDLLSGAAERAIDDGVDLVIGGDVVCQTAKERSVPALFLASGQESIAEAFRVSEKVAYAIDAEKKNTAEFKALLDYSFNGIINVNKDGIVLHTNHFVEKLLNKSEDEIIGKHITKIIPGIENGILQQVLVEGKEVYSTVLMIRRAAVVTNLAPILVEDIVQGAIISFHEGSKIVEMEAEIRRELYRKGNIAQFTFETLVGESVQFKEVVEQAKAYAKFNAPVLIIGEDGTEKEMLAQCIQNASVCSNDAFVSVSCDNLPAEKLTAAIFGSGGQNEKGLVELVEGGILFLDKISRLDARAQYLLFQLIRNEVLIRGDDLRPLPAHVRVIASDTQELVSMVEDGLFRGDLYHVLNTLPLRVEPLRDRPEDIQAWVGYYISQFEKKHQRYIHITSGADRLLQETCWAGNLPELCSFCERLVILSPHRSVNESVIYSLMDKNPPLIYKKSTARKMTSAEQDEKSAQLAALLKKYHGKRSLVAQELNISTTTLWRYLKKYGIYENKKSFKI